VPSATVSATFRTVLYIPNAGTTFRWRSSRTGTHHVQRKPHGMKNTWFRSVSRWADEIFQLEILRMAQRSLTGSARFEQIIDDANALVAPKISDASTFMIRKKLFPSRYYVMARLRDGRTIKAARCPSRSDASYWIDVHSQHWLRTNDIGGSNATI